MVSPVILSRELWIQVVIRNQYIEMRHKHEFSLIFSPSFCRDVEDVSESYFQVDSLAKTALGEFVKPIFSCARYKALNDSQFRSPVRMHCLTKTMVACKV